MAKSVNTTVANLNKVIGDIIYMPEPTIGEVIDAIAVLSAPQLAEIAGFAVMNDCKLTRRFVIWQRQHGPIVKG